ncbi:response regulator transcription factor [Hansschlegelia beijingensis]|uniref:FixJ family two-component response regulator n=1 Tax=Hansschlegelia beijingensis TaxID=1133344 RepID=A0A7W6D4Q8_9HYPH|nr:response regulator [Hansschlegelia beijingensis]MBB3974576.1 FixJ family two-component response regulator [Hansschlegelia beijingensis]
MPKPPTIAIVDDDEGVRASLASLVRSLGYQARTYGSGPEFLRDGVSEQPACMISDVQMPAMTGDRLQEVLLSAGVRFPIIFMTAFPTEDVRRKVLANGAYRFLTKPSDGDTLIRCIEDALAEPA